MKPNMLEQHCNILNCLTVLPRHILSLHDHNNISEFVLHDLCGSHCFNLGKAAYFVDNPDFNCFKGVAGFSRNEVSTDKKVWDDPETISQQLNRSPFNQQVKNHTWQSLKTGPEEERKMAEKIAQDLGLEKPQFCTWNMKHDNHGWLIFEREENLDQDQQINDYLSNGVHLLSFCPIT